jgi:hypothetical protein
VKKIPIYNSNRVVLVDDEDYESLIVYTWYLRRDPKGRNLPYVIREGHKGEIAHIAMHQQIMNGNGRGIDHKNGNTLDNRKENLRFATHSQQAANRFKTRGTSQFKGVQRRGDKWRAQIGFRRQVYYLGSFVDEEDAARAYDKAALKFFGEFARINFPLLTDR